MSNIVVGWYVGHGIDTSGRFDTGTTWNGLTEAQLMLPIVQAGVTALRACGVTVYTDAFSGNDINMIKQVAEANRVGAKIFVSTHCDYSKATSGTMPLYVSENGKKLALAMNKYVMADTGLTTHGLRSRPDLYELTHTNGVACIFEVGAIDDDYKVFQNKAMIIGQAMAKGVCEYLGITYKGGGATTNTPTTTKPSSTIYTGTYPTLPSRGYFKSGDRGTQVKYLQQYLNWVVGAGLVVDGIIGSATINAVKKFQQAKGLTFDGLFGVNSLRVAKGGSIVNTTITVKTYTGTFPILPSRGYFKQGDRGTQVKNLQRFLNWAIGAGLVIDGIIGSATINAVKKFQKAVGIYVDGLFGNGSLAKAKTFRK